MLNYLLEAFTSIFKSTDVLVLLCTVQLNGNIALMCYSILAPRDLDTSYSCSDAHNASKGLVVNHSRTDSLEYYPWLFVQF